LHTRLRLFTWCTRFPFHAPHFAMAFLCLRLYLRFLPVCVLLDFGLLFCRAHASVCAHHAPHRPRAALLLHAHVRSIRFPFFLRACTAFRTYATFLQPGLLRILREKTHQLPFSDSRTLCATRAAHLVALRCVSLPVRSRFSGSSTTPPQHSLIRLRRAFPVFARRSLFLRGCPLPFIG